jgi:hypothetical protein
MPTCFVMQPFDGAAFDSRYREVYAPAIVAAGLEPYRVDEDPRVSIPILSEAFDSLKSASRISPMTIRTFGSSWASLSPVVRRSC